jgi:uncharacterized protein
MKSAMAQTADLLPRGGDQPSFDCSVAKAASARLICADADLTRLDRELGYVFQKQRSAVYLPDQARFTADELAWIRARNERCGLMGKNDAAIEVLASSNPCLMVAIQERIAALSGGEQPVTANQALPPLSSYPPSLRLALEIRYRRLGLDPSRVRRSNSLQHNRWPESQNLRRRNNRDTA